MPQLIHVNNVGNVDVPGGELTSNTGAAAALNGIQFGPGGLLENYTLGDCSYYATTTIAPFISTTTTTTNTSCYGGTGNQSTSASEIGLMSFPLQQGTGFFYGSYKITPDIQASMMLNYGYDRSHSSSLTIRQTAVIKSDNAYLNPSLLQAMKSDAVTQVTVSSDGTDGISLAKPDRYFAVRHSRSALRRRSRCASSIARLFTLDGAIGDDWSWSAYYQHSESHLYEVYHHIEITAEPRQRYRRSDRDGGECGQVGPGSRHRGLPQHLDQPDQWLLAVGHHGPRGREPAGGQLCGRQ